ncbi:hypothetical protein SEA_REDWATTLEHOG_161 [Gordonia phage RedWattleHog]|uniref:Uncharacterized protein n=1 Tax=Gordonia phage Stormageddon TaxID=2656541 RepID=A0A649VSW8_9CAUD|nr:hypothetical protein KHQ86_gp138 [Gordonia phage Stormageddon]QGJ95022.1 hypothetical protein SEA_STORMAGEDDON_162 [Gordonia phage Stormageddon]QLF83664.1 hypothetical protein SEA_REDWATTLEHOG_161 [Gordonia phage RedWattleHog]
MTPTKTNARTRMLARVADLGWELDPTAKVPLSRFERHVLVQNETAFRKRAAHGGWWKILLDYSQTSGSWRTVIGTTLRGIQINWTENEVHSGKVIGVLKNPRSSRYGSRFLWLASGDPSDPMKKHAETFLADPDLVVWLSQELRHKDIEETRARHAEQRRIEKLREQLLPVKGLTENARWRFAYVSPFKRASAELIKADGLTDLPKVMAETWNELERLVEYLTPEAREAFQKHLDDLSGAAVTDLDA